MWSLRICSLTPFVLFVSIACLCFMSLVCCAFSPFCLGCFVQTYSFLKLAFFSWAIQDLAHDLELQALLSLWQPCHMPVVNYILVFKFSCRILEMNVGFKSFLGQLLAFLRLIGSLSCWLTLRNHVCCWPQYIQWVSDWFWLSLHSTNETSFFVSTGEHS